MALQKLPPKPQEATGKQDAGRALAFIDGAPDSSAKAKTPRGNKERVMIQLAAELLSDVDEAAKLLGLSRSAFISMAAAEKAKSCLR